jgi:uncharacterized protein (DUF433 family)
LHGKPRGRVQKATPDILSMRNWGATIDNIARVLYLSRASIKAVIRQYPRWEIHDPAVTEQVLGRHAAGEGTREIARALGLEIGQVRRLIGVTRWQAKPTRKRAEPLAEDRRAAILALRRQGKTGLEIYAELGVETERERQQIRRFLQRQARREPELALRNPPGLTDEIDVAKSEAKAPEDYTRREDTIRWGTGRRNGTRHRRRRSRRWRGYWQRVSRLPKSSSVPASPAVASNISDGPCGMVACRPASSPHLPLFRTARGKNRLLG